MSSVWPSEGGMGAAGCESAFIVTADFCRAQSEYAHGMVEDMETNQLWCKRCNTRLFLPFA